MCTESYSCRQRHRATGLTLSFAEVRPADHGVWGGGQYLLAHMAALTSKPVMHLSVVITCYDWPPALLLQQLTSVDPYTAVPAHSL
jgi:hypothetical protein